MGIDAADVDGDGWQDVYVTHLDFELNRLYHNNRDGTLDDSTYRSGIGNKAVLLSGVSMKLLDYDNDGWPDILQLNGAMLDNVNLYHSEVSYKEPLLMFRHLGKGQFEKVSDSLGPGFVRPIAGRGLGTADFDNDGDIDIAINNRGDFPELLRNDGGNLNHWLEVLLIGTKSNRDGIGSSLKLTSERSEEHTSELQSQSNLVCRLLLEKKKHIALQSSLLSLRHRLLQPLCNNAEKLFPPAHKPGSLGRIRLLRMALPRPAPVCLAPSLR